MAHEYDTQTLTPVERAFLESIRGAAQGTSDELKKLCEHQPEFRNIYESWEAALRLIDDRVDGAPVGESLEAEFGARIDRQVYLGAPTRGDDAGEPKPAAEDVVYAQRQLRYEMGGEIARGGMGVVFKVRDVHLHRDLAMRVVGDQSTSGATEGGGPRVPPGQLDRFLEEAQITGQLVHPGIVPIHELGIDSTGRIYCTMQLVSGETFDQIIKRVRERDARWTLTSALHVIIKVCEAVGYAHSKGVMHRDLTPAHVMVGRFGETYVMDWGHARVQGRDAPGGREAAKEVAEDAAVDVGADVAEDAAAEDAPFHPPFGAPADALFGGPEDLPADAPCTPPIVAPGDALFIGPEDLPADAPCTPPIVAPGDALFIGPEDLPADAPFTPPFGAPADVPLIAPEDLRADAPFHPPFGAPVDAPFVGPEDLPEDAPFTPPFGAPLDASPAAAPPSLVETEAPEPETPEPEIREPEPPQPASESTASSAPPAGTPSFMAPEQARGDVGAVGPRSDVYSIGAMLYQLLTGEAPYLRPGASCMPATVLETVIDGPPDPVRELDPTAPAELAVICEKAMSRDPRERYATPMQMARDLDAYLGRRSVSPPKRSLGDLFPLAEQHKKAAAIAVAAAVLLAITLVLLLGVGLAGDDPTGEPNTRGRAEPTHRQTERLFDFASAELLRGRVDRLHPSVPRMVPDMLAWVEEVDARLLRLATYEREHAALGAASRDDDDARRLRAGVANLRALRELRPTVAARIETATELRDYTVRGEAARAAWGRAIASIAAAPIYGGLALEPQLGLIPLWQNDAGYWEFWHVLSGAPPERDPITSQVVVAPETGIVLVLLPGGTFEMGSPATEFRRRPNEALRTVELAPVLISKYEVTQPQWQRTMGVNPSLYKAGDATLETPSRSRRTFLFTDTHPVESVNWEDCVAFASRMDLRLPTEAEWEYACRANTRTAYCWGADTLSLRGRENVFDRDCSPTAGSRGGGDWEDGFTFHSPVGKFAANGFGLFDMHGNVSEWCADWYRSSDPPDHVQARKIFRGGSWYLPLWRGRSAFRQFDSPKGLNHARGVRLARDVRG